jgi:hypothetical protein
MHQDRQYEHALSAALVILDELDKMPDMGKHTRLSLVVFSILSAMKSWDQERGEWHAEFSVN